MPMIWTAGFRYPKADSSNKKDVADISQLICKWIKWTFWLDMTVKDRIMKTCRFKSCLNLKILFLLCLQNEYIEMNLVKVFFYAQDGFIWSPSLDEKCHQEVATATSNVNCHAADPKMSRRQQQPTLNRHLWIMFSRIVQKEGALNEKNPVSHTHPLIKICSHSRGMKEEEEKTT